MPPFVSTGWTDVDVIDIVAGAGGSQVGLVGVGLNLTFTASHSNRGLCGEIDPEPVR